MDRRVADEGECVMPDTVAEERVISMQAGPGIWDDTPFYTSGKTVLGELAGWAVRQSPYTIPDRLAKALSEFHHVFGMGGKGDVWQTNCKELRQRIERAIEKCPLILAWNDPKEGDHKLVFVDRYGGPDPDHDFIDLDALARNVAHAVTLQEKFSLAHDSSLANVAKESV